mgnify:CR=1 FL=1
MSMVYYAVAVLAGFIGGFFFTRIFVVKKNKNGYSTDVDVLEKLKNDGYEFVTVSELIYWNNAEIDYSGKQKSIS